MRKTGFDLILLGAPAAGKDTQALRLLAKYRFKPVESGKHWRRMAKQRNAEGELLRRTFAKGRPAPVKLMKRFLEKSMRSAKASENLLFIGNPRLKPEAQLLTKLLKVRKRDYLVIGIDLSVIEIRRRSLKRRRDDQDWKYVDNRIAMYLTQVKKTLDYFKKLGKLKMVDGDRSIARVGQDIEEIINDYQRQQANRASTAKRADSRPYARTGRQ